MMGGTLSNCPKCRNIKCTCPMGIGKRDILKELIDEIAKIPAWNFTNGPVDQQFFKGTYVDRDLVLHILKKKIVEESEEQ